ncbi:MAG: iron ABC transporter permease, partial [Pseudomonadota bacterium]|nr:iron ABC transporter permease [Pseudomonadota bacterium]
MARFWQIVPLVLLLLIASLVLIPLAVVLSSFVQAEPETWAHLRQYVLPSVLWNTGTLMLGVGTGVLLLGVPLAWFTAVYDFPLRRMLTWGLMLPLAIPAYVFAFIAVGMLEYTSPL